MHYYDGRSELKFGGPGLCSHAFNREKNALACSLF